MSLGVETDGVISKLEKFSLVERLGFVLLQAKKIR